MKRVKPQNGWLAPRNKKEAKLTEQGHSSANLSVHKEAAAKCPELQLHFHLRNLENVQNTSTLILANLDDIHECEPKNNSNFQLN